MGQLLFKSHRRPPVPPIRDPAKLVEYSDEHVYHEVTMLWLATMYEVPAGLEPVVTDYLKNAKAEVFVLHLRNVIAFLYPDRFRPMKGDVCAHHFLPKASYEVWIKERPPLSKKLKHAKKRADVELAHLTDKRISGTPKAKHWVPSELLPDLNPVLVAFLRCAAPDRLGQKGRTMIKGLSEWISTGVASA